VSALSVDGGRVSPAKDTRVSDPAIVAGQAFAALLGAPAAQVLRGTAAAGAAPLGVVESPTVAQLVERMLTYSDNDLAETLARQLALAEGQPPTFAGGAAAVRTVLGGLLPDGTVAPVDGSGLSRDDRVQPAALTALLSRVARAPDGRLSAVLSGLPVAGFDGTLEKRFRTGGSVPAAGEVRAKTGTLEGVSALAGYVRTADGRLLAFDVSLDAVPVGATRAAEAALDAVATALAGCGCR
jgi:D-alanyl-D-alanine carboxypeptidase/D-alanyl-D-alanine-endopeptidase (penicillin-binding protein 4)